MNEAATDKRIKRGEIYSDKLEVQFDPLELQGASKTNIRLWLHFELIEDESERGVGEMKVQIAIEAADMRVLDMVPGVANGETRRQNGTKA